MTGAAQLLQEAFYDEAVDYRAGSPHLAHWQLHDHLTGVLRRHVRQVGESGLPLTVLEIGAGHGGYTEPALAAGAEVTAVEMARPSLRRLTERFGANPGFRAVPDADGTLAAVRGHFSLVLCVAVLHHIPDYLSYLDRLVGHVTPGGSLLTLQDPLWFPRTPRATRLLDRAAYYTWRLGRGDLARGASTVGRRLRGVYDEANPSDMVEYHVVRQGVDEAAVRSRLGPHFERVELLPYWSNQLSAGQWLGDRLGCRNTFGVSAVGRRG